jgi:hypothetical protein
MASSRRFNLSGVQVSAGVLATLTGAIAASYLGVGGTLVGAAVGSLASTVGGEVYRHYLERTHDRLRGAVDVRRSQTARSAVAAPRAISQHDPARDSPAETSAASGSQPEAGSAGIAGAAAASDSKKKKRPRWLVLTAITVGTFLIAVAAITVIELSVGKPFFDILRDRHGSGTTITGVIGGRTAAPAPAVRRPTPTAARSATPAASASVSASGSATPSSTSAAPTSSPSASISPGGPDDPVPAPTQSS